MVFESSGSKEQPGENKRVIQKISGLLEMWRTSCSDLLWERAEETRADGRTRSAASPQGEERVRTASGRQTIAPVFSEDAKQFAAGLVGLFYPGKEAGILWWYQGWEALCCSLPVTT